MDRKQRRRLGCLVVLLSVVVLAIWFGKPVFILVSAWWKDRPSPENLPLGVVDDASRLNATRVAEVWDVPEDPAEAEEQIRTLLQRAHAAGQRVAIAGARHSMGGHTIYPDGIALNMLPFKRLELDADRKVLHVGAGARWADVIPYLDERGLSVSVMQATHNFTVGGSLSVNCHGWQVRRSPIAATVESFRLMDVNGQVLRCSRAENRELFSLALGGYGLFGVILDVDLQVVANERYQAGPPLIVPSDRCAAAFRERTADAGVAMAIGRLDVTPGGKTFLRQALLTTFRHTPGPRAELPALKSPGYQTLRRTVLLAEIGSDAGKELRWQLESKAARHLEGKYFSRNQLLNEDAELYQEKKSERTEILHEYFVPPDQLEAFLERVRTAVPRHRGDLLHVTLRDVREDKDTVLRYADRDLLALVMLFSQPRTEAGETHMEAMTRELIDASLECGGRFYLPYRLHFTKDQFDRAYPQARELFARKRHYDPGELFQNQFYMKYALP